MRQKAATATSNARLRTAVAIMLAELDECGYACSCGEPRFKGKPCVQCRMAAFTEGKRPIVMFIRKEMVWPR